jgi:hypothetical protein
VYKLTINTLDASPLTMTGAIESQDLFQLARPPSGPTMLGHPSRQCSNLDALAGHVNDLLAQLMPKSLGKR